MNVEERIKEDLKAAMKTQDKLRTAVLRMILADIKIAETSGKPKDQIDYEGVVSGYLKRLKKGREEYEKLGQQEKMKELDKEIAIVEEYLPKQLSDDEIKKAVEEIVNENKFTSKDMGTAMRMIMSKYGGMVDGKKVQLLLKERLVG